MSAWAGRVTFLFQLTLMKMNREKLDGWCERGILGLVLAIMVFGPLAFGAVQTELFVVIQWLTAGVLILWAARLWIADRARFLCPPICWICEDLEDRKP